MKITFQITSPPLEGTECFELVYPEALQVDLEHKAKLLIPANYPVWLLVDGKLAGEMYGLPDGEDDEGIPDISDSPDNFYIGSFTILPEYQGRGLGRLLFAYSLARLQSCFDHVSLHATSEGMTALSDLFGLKVGPTRRNWFGTGKPAIFRYLDIP